MARMIFRVGDSDFSNCLDKHSYKIDYEIREGQNGGTMLNGAIVRDIIAQKMIVTVNTNPHMADDTMTNLAKALSGNIVTATLSDIGGGTYTSLFYPSVTGFQAANYIDGTILWKDGATITLTEV